MSDGAPRIAPLEPPFPDWFAEAMARTMPPGMPPLRLFTTMATSERAWRKFAGGSLLDRGPLSLRQREIVILRTTARTGCEYEWGIHVAGFAARAGLDEAAIAATVHGGPGSPSWSEGEAGLVAAVDALLDRKRLDDREFAALAEDLAPEALLEVIQLVGFYHMVALVCGGLALPLESGAPRFPPAPSGD
ncbi:MAG: carboxymuconolactone decarboxylase family protein [Sphingomonadaceae bacterium]